MKKNKNKPENPQWNFPVLPLKFELISEYKVININSNNYYLRFLAASDFNFRLTLGFS